VQDHDDLLSEQELELIRSGEMFAPDDPLFLALKEAARIGDANDVSLNLDALSAQGDGSRRPLGDIPALPISSERRREQPVNVVVRITPTAREVLRGIAESYDMWHGGHGNLSQLFEAIGQGKLQIVRGEERG
jgi:hypothetical protein